MKSITELKETMIKEWRYREHLLFNNLIKAVAKKVNVVIVTENET